MNVATSSAAPLPSPTRVDATNGPTRIALGPDSESVDTPVETDATGGAGFGRILSRNLNGGGSAGATRPDDAAGEPGADGALRATPLATGQATGFGLAVPEDLYSNAGSVASAKSTGDDELSSGSRNDRGSDASADDLAAQLALVSQWAAVASAPAPQAASRDVSAGDGLDIKGKLDAVRQAPSKDARDPAGSAAVVQVGVADSSQGVATPLVAAGARGVDRSGRPASGTLDPTVALADGKARDKAGIEAVGERLSASELLLGKLDGGTTHVQSDASAFASAFVTQLAAQASNAQAPASTTSSGLATSSLHEPVGTPAWSHEVGQATLRLAAGDLQTASLRLNPENLGPLDVQVRIDNGIAHLTFNAAHAQTRHAIEASRTTLDQLFADQGLKIGDCAVGDSSSRRGFDADASQADTARRPGDRWNARAAAGDEEVRAATITTRLTKALGLVDTFA